MNYTDSSQATATGEAPTVSVANYYNTVVNRMVVSDFRIFKRLLFFALTSKTGAIVAPLFCEVLV